MPLKGVSIVMGIGVSQLGFLECSYGHDRQSIEGPQVPQNSVDGLDRVSRPKRVQNDPFGLIRPYKAL